MSPRQPFKLLEISVLSAQHLAPVSKLLRTYAVAWVDPDQKLTTRVDHQGHTNPTWNYRFVFRVDDDFLNSDTSAITIEIYNVSWLRDIPVGTVHALINTIIPPSVRSQQNSTMQFVPLQIRRPSGALHGILNLGVNLIDCTRRSMPLDSELSPSTCSAPGGDRDLMVMDDNKMKKQSPYPKRNYANREDEDEDEDDEEQGKNEKKKKKKKKKKKNQQKEMNVKVIKLWRSRSERTVSTSVNEDSPYKARVGLGLNGKHSKFKAATPVSTSSYYMRPIPSEVAKGMYLTSEVGSSIFENWTVMGDDKEDVMKSKVVRWKSDEFGQTNDHSWLSKKHSKSNGGGRGGRLLSCFGIVCGYECNIICGAPKSKNNNNKKNKSKSFGRNMVYVNNHCAENLRLLHK